LTYPNTRYELVIDRWKSTYWYSNKDISKDAPWIDNSSTQTSSLVTE